MPSSKNLTLLGFAAKALKLDYGMQKSIEALKKNRSKLIVTACDLSEKSKKEILFYTTKQNIRLVTSDVTIEKLSTEVGRKCGVISVNDNGFADAIFNNQEANSNANDQ
ncbi:MAG: ribosomal L7Ae/L30e/S12e/Gadd45 family protein [Clostridia bacterium]|nr:ribosomal L7Ae/L30e/S12e/Gadd45 family protein [Clostridia bacterium]